MTNMRVERLLIVAAILLVGLGLPPRAVGQGAGAASGTVVDAAGGAPVAGAVVRLEGDDMERSTVTGADGSWRIGELSPGTYTVRVSRLGFAEGVTRVGVGEGDRDVRVAVALRATALPLDALVVTASRRMQRLSDAPVTTELITRREIERMGVSDLSRVLLERTGIELEPGVASGEGVMIQGLSSERVLVLIDGQPLVGRISGQIDVSRIPTSMIERVEVLKGPQSSLYGSEAMGGVVNVITRRAALEPWNLELEATGGSQGRADLAASVRGTVGSVRYLVDGGRRSTDLTPGRPEERGAQADRWDGLLKLGWSPDSSLVVEASGLVLDERQRWQTGQLFTFADNRQFGAQASASWTLGAHRLTPAIHWTRFEHLSRRATTPEPQPNSGEDETQQLLEGEILYNGGFGDLALDAGIEARREAIESDRVLDHDRTLHTVEPFAQLTWAVGNLSLVPGARVTWSEQWGSYFAPRLAALYRPLAPLALRASVGRGYRAPSFKELYMEFLNISAGTGYAVRGNPTLQPETSTNVSGGVEWATAGSYLRAQVFYNRFDDFIETGLVGDSSGVAVYTYQNIEDGYTRGVELEGGVVRGAVRVEAGYGYLQARESATDQQLLGRPTHSGRLSVEADVGSSTRAALTGVYTGTAPVQRTEEGMVERDAYLRFDLRLAQSLPRNLELSLGVRNLLGATPEHWPGFAGRHFYVGVGWSAAGLRSEPIR